MNPIISPWLFYAINICHAISAIALVISLFAAGYLMLVVVASMDDDDFAPKILTDRRKIKLGIKVLIATLAIFIVVPNEQTAYKMIAASLITPDNIAAVQGNTIDFIQKVAEAIANVKH